MPVELEDKDFEVAERRKQHKDLKESLDGIAKSLSENKSNEGIVKVIKENNAAISQMTKEVASLREVKPEVEVVVENKEVAVAISEMCKKLDDIYCQNEKVIELLQTKKKIKFTIERDKFNNNIKGGEFIEL
jgi:23S rRNA A1618 N6-methylase RlmF